MSINDALDDNRYMAQKLSAKLKMLYLNLFVSSSVTLFSASIIFFTLYQTVHNREALHWYMAVMAITLFRLSSIFVYKRYNAYQNHLFALFTLGAMLSAIAWGYCGARLTPGDNLLQQTIIIVVIAGVSAGALQMFQSMFLLNIAYLSVVMLPLSLWLFLQDSIGHYILGASVSGYLIFTMVTAWRSSKMIDESLQLRFENMALIEGLSESNSQLFLINRMNEALQTCKEVNEAYTVISHCASELFPLLSGGLIVGDPVDHHFDIVAKWGENDILKEHIATSDCWALRTGRAYVVQDSKKQLLCQHYHASPMGGVVCVPQVTQSGVGGVMVLVAPPGQGISDHQLRLANTFNDVIKLSLINIRLLEMLSDRSIRDPLTALYNRRFLEEMLPRELVRMEREKSHLCVCMVDIDFFKQFNDSYGHEAGDEVLKVIAKILTDKLRRHDIVCRMGGEEFVLVFINATTDAVVPKMKVISDNIKHANILYRDQLLSNITISVGVAEAPTHTARMQDLIRHADEALYTAKQNGRDRIEVFGAKITEVVG